MARDAENQAKKTYGTSADLTASSTGKAGDLYGQLIPQYTQEMTNPQGFGAKDLADMDTASGQATGGGLGAAVGEADQLSASNRNMGGFAPALDEAARGAGRQLSASALDTRIKNAALKQAQKQQGIAGLAGLEDQQNQDILSSLGLQNTATNALTEAGKSGWYQNMIAGINAVTGAGKAAGEMGYKPFAG